MYWHAATESPNWKSHLTSHATDVVAQGDKRTSLLAESNTDLVDYAREENTEWKSTILMYFFAKIKNQTWSCMTFCVNGYFGEILQG